MIRQKNKNIYTGQLGWIGINLTGKSNSSKGKKTATGHRETGARRRRASELERGTEATKVASSDGCLPSSSAPPPIPSPGSRRGSRSQDLGPPHPDLARHLPLQVSSLPSPAPPPPPHRHAHASPLTSISISRSCLNSRRHVLSVPAMS